MADRSRAAGTSAAIGAPPPSTRAQRDRYDRVLRAATAVLAESGESGLQMKELAERADVSLATLYRYFPSKDHLLLAIATDRYQRALQRVQPDPFPGARARERVAAFLLRSVLGRATSENSAAIEYIMRLSAATLAKAAGPMTIEETMVLPLVTELAHSLMRRWLVGLASAAETRRGIVVGCRLLDVPSDAIEADWAAADALS
jgi:AcrR family transcriptional regulator